MALEQRWSKCITLEGNYIEKEELDFTGNKLGWLLTDSPSYYFQVTFFKKSSDAHVQAACSVRRNEKEAIGSRRRKKTQGKNQENSEGSKESKGGLDRCSVQGD